MESILRELLFGEISPIESFYRTTPQAREAREAYTQLMDRFEEQMRGPARRGIRRGMRLSHGTGGGGVFPDVLSGTRFMLEMLDPHMVF